MIDPSLALQKLIRTRLTASSALTALVPATSIRDLNRLPDAYPLIQISADTTNYPREFESWHSEVFASLHIWTKEDGSIAARQIAGAIVEALRERPWTADDHEVITLNVRSARYMRDPEGEHCHAVLTVRAILQEMVS